MKPIRGFKHKPIKEQSRKVKKYIIPLTLITLTLCACKGRTASVADSDGDTIEVVVNPAAQNAEAAPGDSLAARAGEEFAEPTPRPDVASTHTESPAEASGLRTRMTSETAERMPESDVSFGK